MSTSSLSALLAVDSVERDVYVSKCLPRGMGNTAPIAYGGNTIGIAVSAAYDTVVDRFTLFSLLGSFHGPTRTDRQVYCRVERTRDTKTFATRRVVVYQIQDDQSARTCAEIFADFHAREKGMYEYSAPPALQYQSHPEDPTTTITTADLADKLLKSGELSQAALDVFGKSFAMMHEFYESRICLNGSSGQTFHGVAKNAKTSQDHLPIHEKSSAEWSRTREALTTDAQRAAALTFNMDGALSFLPLHLDHKDLYDAGACSTLDFALRILAPTVLLDSWHLKERKTVAAHGGRTYSEARLWNQDGQLVAIESQTCILRPPPTKSRPSTTKL